MRKMPDFCTVANLASYIYIRTFMNKVIFFFHNAKLLKIPLSFALYLFLNNGCSTEPTAKDVVLIEAIVITKNGAEKKIRIINDQTLFDQLLKLSVSNRPDFFCPISHILKYTFKSGQVLSVPLCLCEGNEHIYTKRDRRWGSYRIDPRKLPLLDSLFQP